MKISDRIHLLRIDFEIILSPENKMQRFVNVLLILGDKITLIDTGVKNSEGTIANYLRSLNRDISEVGTIILSHSHPDHIGSAARIKELTQCKVIAHVLEKEWIEDIAFQNRQRPVPGFFSLVNKPVIVDECISGNHEMRIHDGLTLQFIESPGHSKGSLNIFFVEDKVLFTADSIPLKNDIPNYDNYIELMQSLKKIKNNHRYKTLLTSWTPPLTASEEMKKIIDEGEKYMKHIDAAVNACYNNRGSDSLDSCRLTVEKLGLPPFLVNPIVDKAFRSHLKS